MKLISEIKDQRIKYFFLGYMQGDACICYLLLFLNKKKKLMIASQTLLHPNKRRFKPRMELWLTKIKNKKNCRKHRTRFKISLTFILLLAYQLCIVTLTKPTKVGEFSINSWNLQFYKSYVITWINNFSIIIPVRPQLLFRHWV